MLYSEIIAVCSQMHTKHTVFVLTVATQVERGLIHQNFTRSYTRHQTTAIQNSPTHNSSHCF